MVNIARFCTVAIIALTFLSGCIPADKSVTVEPTPSEPMATMVVPATQVSTFIENPQLQNTTQNNLTGNHFIKGSLDIQNASFIDIPLDGKPVWLVSTPWMNGVIFVAVMEDGRAQAFKFMEQTYETTEITPAQLPAGMPPLLITSNNKPQLVSPPIDASLLTNPILVGDYLVYIASNGDLVINDARLSVNALPDSRILVDENIHLLVLSDPTTRYDHGVVGDELEASAITLIETEPEIRVIRTIKIQEPDVIEGISAIWADINNDEYGDIIVTLSNNQTGARIVAFNEDGSLLAESDPIGLGYRWRHQLAVAEFEADKPPFLVSVRTPHIGGIVEFFQYNNGRLEIVKEIKGFSAHSIGSRNLDSAIAADFNNDGIVELLAPDQPYTSLGVISINGVLATIPLKDVLTTNLSGTEVGGKLYVGAGTQGNLRIWVP